MDSPKNIKIPEHWLIDTGITTYWPYAEGIWVNEDTEPIFYLTCVYQALLDIPEAKSDLLKCNERFINEYAKELLSLFNPVMQQVRAGRKATTPVVAEADNDKIIAIYRPWVDTWALGSQKMLVWVSGSNIPNILFDILKGSFSRKESRQLEHRISELGAKFSPPWVWKTLLSGEYRRIDQTNRELARRTIQSQGFNHRKEATAIIRARWWIIVRVLNLTESQLDQMLGRGRHIDSYSHDLEPIDKALGFERIAGPPVGKQRGIKRANILNDIAEYERKMRL